MTNQITQTFTVGKTYTCRSVCDHNCIWSFEVIARTAKMVTLKDERGKVIKKGIKLYDDTETCMPLGVFSMAPILRA